MEESSQQSELKKLQCFTKNCRQWGGGGGRAESRERAGGQAPVGFRLGGENLRLRCEYTAFGILVGQCFMKRDSHAQHDGRTNPKVAIFVVVA